MIIVCGAESSGNRLAAGILLAALGGRGEGSTNQPKDRAAAEAAGLSLAIVHFPLRTNFYRPGDVLVCPVRDTRAVIGSMMHRRHAAGLSDARWKVDDHRLEMERVVRTNAAVVFFPYELLGSPTGLVHLVVGRDVDMRGRAIWVDGKAIRIDSINTERANARSIERYKEYLAGKPGGYDHADA